MSHKNGLLALCLDSYKVRANEEIKRLRAENERLREVLGGYRIIEQLKGK